MAHAMPLYSYPTLLRLCSSAHGSKSRMFLFHGIVLFFRLKGSANKCFLYYTANSGILGRRYTRQGDKHNMEFSGRFFLHFASWRHAWCVLRSLKLWDTLPRLCDAAMSSECPELQLMRSWRSMLTEAKGLKCSK